MKYARNVTPAILVAAFSFTVAAQCGSVDRSSPEAVRTEVNQLFTKTLDADGNDLALRGKDHHMDDGSRRSKNRSVA